VAARRRNRKDTNVTTVPPVKVSTKAMATYRRALQKSNQQYKKQVDKKVRRLLKSIDALDANDPSAFSVQAGAIQDEIASLQRNLVAANKRSNKALDSFIKTVDRENRQRTIRSFANHVDAKEAERLIKSKNKQLARRTTKLRREYAASLGKVNAEYSERVQTLLNRKLANPRFKVGKQLRRARAIVSRRIVNKVKDQAHQLNAVMNNIRQRALGAKRYRWQDRRDDRVRNAHRDAHGDVYSWTERPAKTAGFRPGEDYGCRCNAIPIID